MLFTWPLASLNQLFVCCSHDLYYFTLPPKCNILRGKILAEIGIKIFHISNRLWQLKIFCMKNLWYLCSIKNNHFQIFLNGSILHSVYRLKVPGILCCMLLFLILWLWITLTRKGQILKVTLGFVQVNSQTFCIRNSGDWANNSEHEKIKTRDVYYRSCVLSLSCSSWKDNSHLLLTSHQLNGVERLVKIKRHITVMTLTLDLTMQ